METLVDMLEWFGTPVGELAVYAITGSGMTILTLVLRGFWTSTSQEQYRTAAWYFAAVAIVEWLMALLQCLVVIGSGSFADLSRALIPPLLVVLDAASLLFLYPACTLFIVNSQRRNVVRLARLGFLMTLGIYAITAFTWPVVAGAHPELEYVDQWQSWLGIAWGSLLGLGLIYLLARYGTEQRNVILVGFLIIAFGMIAAIVIAVLAPAWETHAFGLYWLASVAALPFFALAVLRSATVQLAEYVREMEYFGRDMQRRNRELFFLAETGRAIIRGRDLAGMLRRAIEHVVLALDAQAGAVFLLDDEQPSQWHLVTTFDSARRQEIPHLEDTRYWSSHPILASARELRQAHYLRVTAERPMPGLTEDVQTALLQPLRVREQTVGVVVIGTRQPRMFSDADMSFCQTLANQMAVAIENARLQDETGQRAAEVALLHEVGRVITSSLDLEETTQSILASMGRLIDYTVAEICLYDEEKNILTTQGIVGPHQRQTYQMGEGLTGWVAEHRQPKLIADVEEEPQIRPQVTHTDGEVWLRAYVGVPLLIGDRLVGTLELAHREAGAFDARTLRLLREVAAQAAVAVENARLYSQTDEHLARRVDELNALSRLGREFSALLDQDELLTRTLEEAMHVTKAPRGSLSLVNWTQQTGQVQVWRGYQPRPETVAEWSVKEDHIVSQTILSGVAQLASHSAPIPPFAPPDTRSQLAVPIHYGTAILGVLHLTSDSPQAFTHENQHFVQALADQAALALQNAQLFENVSRKASDFALLNEVSRTFTAELDLDELLDVVASSGAEILRCPYATLFLVSPDSDTLIPRAAYGRALDQLQDWNFALGQGVAGWVAKYNMSVLVPDTTADERFVPTASIPADEPWAMIAVPLLIKDRAIGVLCVDEPAPRVFTTADQVLLSTLADQAATAIENARLYKAERQQSAQMQALRETAQAITSTLRLETVFTQVLDRLQAVVEYDSVALWLREGRQLRVVAARGFPNLEEILSLVMDTSSNPLFGVLAETQQPLIVDDTLQDERFLVLGGTTYVRSWLGVPLVMQDEVIGCMTIDRREPHSYTPEDAQLALSFANQAAVAISNARLFQERDRHITELAIVNEIGQAVSSTLELESLLETVYKQVSRLFDTTNFYIAAYYQDTDEWAMLFHLEHGERQPSVRRKVAAGLTGYIIRSRQSVLFHSTEDNVALEKKQGVQTIGERAKSWLGVPLIAADTIVGVMAIQSYEQENLYDEQDLALFTTVADQVAIAFANLRLLEETRRRAQELEVINEVGETITSVLDLDTLLRQIVDTIKVRFDHYVVIIALVEGDSLVFKDGSTIGDTDVRQAPGETIIDLLHGPSLMAEAVRTDQPVLVNDVLEDPRFLPSPYLTATRAELTVPLEVKGRIIGVLDVQSDHPNAYDQTDVALLQSLASQAAVAIENAQLYEQTDAELARRIEELNVIEEIDRQLSSTLDYERVIEMVLDHAMSASSAQAGVIALLEPDAKHLVILAERGYPDEMPVGSSWRTDRGVTGRVARTGQPVLIADVTQEPDYAAVVTHTRSELTVPIRREDRVLGVLNLESPDVGAFSEGHLSFAEHLAEHAGIAIENARLFAETQRRAEEMTGLFEISALASSTLNLGELLPKVMDRTLELLDAEKGTVLLFDESRQELVAQHIASVGITPEQVAEFRIPADSENFQYSNFRTGRSYRTADAQIDPHILPAYRPFIEEFDIHSLAGVPLRVADRIIGEMYVANKRTGAFTEDDERLLSAVVTQFAAAIENARLYQLTDAALEKRVDELSAIQRIGQELNATLDLEQVLLVLIREAINTTRSSHGNVVLRDPETMQFRTNVWYGYDGEDERTLRAMVTDPQDEESVTAQVLRSGQPVLIRDVQEWPFEVCVRLDTRSTLTAPISYAGAVVGAINLRSLKPDAFHEEDLAFVQALADQASVAIGNAQRYREQVQQAERLRQRASQLTSVLEVGNVLRMDLSLDEILTEVAYAITEGSNFNSVLINVVEGDPPVVRRAAGAGLPLPMLQELQAVRQPLEKLQPVLQDEFRVSESYFVPCERREEVFKEWHAVLLELSDEEHEEYEWRTGDEFLVPMRGTDGAFLGYISLNDPRDHLRPTQRVAEGLEIFANQGAIAIENARLFESLERRVETQRGLLEMATALQGVLDSRRIYEILADYLGHMFDFGHFTCYEVDWKSRSVSAAYALGSYAEETLAEVFGVEEGITGHVAHSGQAEMVNNALDDPRMVHIVGTPQEAESMLAVPLLARDTVLGVMDVYRIGQDRVFTEDEFAIAQLFANQAAAAVENARLFEETQRRLRELAALNEMALALSATLELGALVDMVYRQTARVMDASNFFIALYDPALDMVSFPIATENHERVETRADFATRRRGHGMTEYVIDSGLPVLIERDMPGWMEAHGIAVIGPQALSWLGVPFYVGDQVTGIITVQSYEREGAYDEDHVSLLSTIAAQAAVAVNNARLFEETQRRLGELRVLNQVGQTISSASLNLDELLDEVYRQAGELMDTTNFYIALYDADQGTVSFPISVDEYDALRKPRSLGTGLTAHIIETRQPILIREDVLGAHQRLGIEVSGTIAKSWLGVPMLAGDKVLGVIAVQSYSQERLYDESHREVLSTLAAQAAIAIENARLFEETQRRLVELAALNRVGRAISSAALSLDELLEEVHRQTNTLMDATNFYVALYDAERDLISFPFSVDEYDAVREPRTPSGLTGHIIHTRQPILIRENVTESIRQLGIELMGTATDEASWLGVPMLIGEEVLGVIAVQNYHQERVYDENHLELLSTLAAQTAVAVQNARLFEETQRRLGELAALNKVSQAISSALNLGELLEVVYRQTGTLMDTTNFYIALYDPERDEVSFQLVVEKGERVIWAPRQSGQGLTEYVIHSREPLLLTRDVYDKLEKLGIAAIGEQAHSWLGVPMLTGDQVLGIIAIQSYTPDQAYDEGHLEILSTIAAQTAVAIDNIRLYEETRAQVEEMTSLYGISLGASSTDVEQALQLIADGALAMTDAAVSTISLPDPETGRLVHRAISAESTQLLESAQRFAPRPDGLSAQILASRQPVVIPDTATAPQCNPSARDVGIQAVAGVPLTLRDQDGGMQAIGVLFVNYTEPHVFHERELRTMSFLANRAAIAVESAQLFEEIRQFSQVLERRVEERTEELATEKDRIETLHNITTELSATLLDMDQLLNRALEHLVRSTDAERGAILWLDRHQEQLVYRAAYGQEVALPTGGKVTSLRPGAGLAGWVIQRRQPVIVPDVHDDERWVIDPESQTRSVMAVPIVAGDDVLGVVTLSHSVSDFFTDDQARLASTIVSEVGIAAHNAELYVFVREQASSMAELYRTQESEASKLGAILESIADGVIVSDTTDRIILANEAAERILGTHFDVLEGQEIQRVMGGLFGEGDETFQELRHDLVSGSQTLLGRVFEWEGRVINAQIAPVFTRREGYVGGEFVGLVIVFRDITKEHEVDRMKTEFVSTVSHELRTPLTSIKGYVDLIMDGDAGEINDEVREFLATVQSNSNRLTDLINDLLDISRIESGRVRLTLRSVSLQKILDEVLNSNRVQVAEKELELHTDLPPDLPLVHADTQYLYQILNNLVTNATKYTPSGGAITIAAQVADHKVQVDVADTGIGISKEDQKRLFSRFFRADDPKVRAVGGTGLGLAISHSLVNLHGGDMWMTSELNKGSTFSFTLPMSEPEK